MKLLLTNKEIASFLFNQLDHLESCKLLEINEMNTAIAITEFIDRRNRGKYNPVKDNLKFKDRLFKAVAQDLNEYVDRIKMNIENRKSVYSKIINNNIDFFISKIGENKILESYKTSKHQSFVKGAGLTIQPSSEFLRRNNYKNFQEDCLFRNMEGNENLILSKIENNLPFWFIDTGYTNFLNGKRKIWHRLTRNHLHHSKNFEAPVDRLGMFESFPQAWRTSGEKILVIEPGSFSARTFNVDVKKWKKDIEQEIRQYSDRPIVFREKYNKKIRTSLYNHLCNEDYYCVININSAAAIEAIWAGIPAITLATHITNTVCSNSISQINNLQRPNLANWLCMLSYSQFTYEELVNGDAAKIAKKYYE